MSNGKIKVPGELRFYFVAVPGLLLAISVVLVFRILNLPERDPSFAILHPERIVFRTVAGRSAELSHLLARKNPSAFLIFRLHDCYSCVTKGLMDLNDLRKCGYHCFAVAVHDCIADLRGWTRYESFSPFYMLGKADFHAHVTCHAMPVLVIGNSDGAMNFRFITP